MCKVTRRHLLVCLLGLMLSSTAIAEVVRCKDKSGQIIFTDNPRLCSSKEQETIVLKSDNQYTSIVDIKTKRRIKTNFRVPKRLYKKADSTWVIYIEKNLLANDPSLGQQALSKLELNLNDIFDKLPPVAASRLKSLSFYLMWGKQSTKEKPLNGLSYIRKGEANNYPTLDPRWSHSIIVYSAKNLMYLDEVWTKKALMHEMAHAWHITNWPDKHPPIVAAYENAKQQGLYRSIKDYKGRSIPKAYALKNQLEYFSDLSAIYFVGGNYYPFNQEGLSKYDNVGLQLVSSLWGY
ncbi:MAG: hypothetical protein KZQ76_03465 [Candidatus Thiodiazotropha sp. (ex Epidulcina cf. delphinae)]|nr:hypothetical protein [Candidatus Thiodiazotropha sp. (ex Epidulcina cf. delphinae)]